MVSQFVSSHAVNLLGMLDYDFPEGIHAIGRLDRDSEGLLVLTTDKSLTRHLFQGQVSHERTYLVLVKNSVSAEALQKLRSGISIRVKGGGQYCTQPGNASIVESPKPYVELCDDDRVYPPFTWLKISLTEGKFHQVRKMVAAIHHPCRRLVRISIGGLSLKGLRPGDVKEYTRDEFFRLLGTALPE